MAGFGNLVQKAFYLGVGIASYAGEKAGGVLGDLRGQAQKLVDELVERGEITAEEAQKMMNDMVERAQANAEAEMNTASQTPASSSPQPEGPRQIQILDDSESLTAEERQAEAMRQEVEALRGELKKLQ
ncbi:MAG: phasin family protein [Phormidesmis sp.]